MATTKTKTPNYKVIAPWVRGPEKGAILTKAEVEKSGDSVAHLIHTGNIELVADPAEKPLTREQQRAAKRAEKVAKAVAPHVVVTDSAPVVAVETTEPATESK